MIAADRTREQAAETIGPRARVLPSVVPLCLALPGISTSSESSSRWRPVGRVADIPLDGARQIREPHRVVQVVETRLEEAGGGLGVCQPADHEQARDDERPHWISPALGDARR